MTRRKKQTRFDSQRVIFFASLAACFLSLFAMAWLLARSQRTHEQRTVVSVQYVKAEQKKSAENVEVPNAAVVEETLEIGTSPDAPIAEYNEEAIEAESFDDNQEIADAPIEPALPAEPRNVVTEIAPTSFQTNVAIRPKKISEAAIGDRTPGVNPEGNDGSDESVFLTQKYCVYSLVLKKENGSLCYVKLLRPDDWLDSEDVQICRNATGQILDDVDFLTDEMLGLELVSDYAYAVWLELPEMGCVGWAKVVDVKDFEYTPGIGNLVTGTFKHTSDDVIDLVVEGQTKPIGVTNSHPFWSVDREEFVPAGELLQGERLLLFSGDTARVLQKLPRPGPQDVYNIEVFGEHVYLVTPDGIMAHNPCDVEDAIKVTRTKGWTRFDIHRDKGDLTFFVGSHEPTTNEIRRCGFSKGAMGGDSWLAAHHAPQHALNKATNRVSYGRGVVISLPQNVHINKTASHSRRLNYSQNPISVKASMINNLKELREILMDMGLRPKERGPILLEWIRRNREIGGLNL